MRRSVHDGRAVTPGKPTGTLEMAKGTKGNGRREKPTEIDEPARRDRTGTHDAGEANRSEPDRSAARADCIETT
ncbi:MAG: hypothetical protein H0T47_07845 [Planctomycetaceae bacterium]|nr:hypothetical protein [Planctomycetaceae bacterium]